MDAVRGADLIQRHKAGLGLPQLGFWEIWHWQVSDPGCLTRLLGGTLNVTIKFRGFTISLWYDVLI